MLYDGEEYLGYPEFERIVRERFRILSAAV
jgi:hypothetical protein